MSIAPTKPEKSQMNQVTAGLHGSARWASSRHPKQQIPKRLRPAPLRSQGFAQHRTELMGNASAFESVTFPPEYAIPS
jgi:hypothetical protein